MHPGEDGLLVEAVPVEDEGVQLVEVDDEVRLPEKSEPEVGNGFSGKERWPFLGQQQ